MNTLQITRPLLTSLAVPVLYPATFTLVTTVVALILPHLLFVFEVLCIFLWSGFMLLFRIFLYSTIRATFHMTLTHFYKLDLALLLLNISVICYFSHQYWWCSVSILVHTSLDIRTEEKNCWIIGCDSWKINRYCQIVLQHFLPKLFHQQYMRVPISPLSLILSFIKILDIGQLNGWKWHLLFYSCAWLLETLNLF